MILQAINLFSIFWTTKNISEPVNAANKKKGLLEKSIKNSSPIPRIIPILENIATFFLVKTALFESLIIIKIAINPKAYPMKVAYMIKK